MGITSLRRYHQDRTDKVSGPEVEPGETETHDEAHAAELASLAALGEDQQEQAEAANEVGTGSQAQPTGETAESVHPVIQEAGAEVSTKHGDLERPGSSGSTADWVAYAQADPNGAPLDLTARPGLRDAIAAHYLGS